MGENVKTVFGAKNEYFQILIPKSNTVLCPCSILNFYVTIPVKICFKVKLNFGERHFLIIPNSCFFVINHNFIRDQSSR